MTQTIIKVPATGGSSFDPTDIVITDNTSGAFLIKDDAGSPHEYMRIDTTNGQEKTIFKTQAGANTGFFVNCPVVGDVLSIVRGGSTATVFKANAGTALFQVDSNQILSDLISDTRTFKVDGTAVSPLVITGDSNATFTLDESSDPFFKIKRDSTDVLTLKGDTNFTYMLKYDSSGTEAGGDAVENDFKIGTDRTGGSSALLQVTTRKLGLGGGEGVFFAGPNTSQVWVTGPSTFRVQSAELLHNPSSGKNFTSSLQGTSAFQVKQTTGDSIMNIAADSNTTFTLEDTSSAVFKIVDDDSSPRTYFTATENGTVHVDGVKIGRGGAAIADNVAIGDGAFDASQTLHGNSVACGFEAGKRQTNAYNTAFFGFRAGMGVTTGQENTAIGFGCIDGNSGSLSATGIKNTGVGSSAVRTLTSGSENTGVGYYALNAIGTGGDNVALGANAGDAITTGSGNIAIGHESDCDAAGVNQIAIGNGVVVAGTNNFAAIGDSSNAATLDFGAGGSWTSASDVRIKENIQDGDLGLAFINSLRPVKHTSKDPAQWPEEIRPAEPSDRTSEELAVVNDGLIAQEVKASADALGTSFSGWEQDENGLNRLQYERFVVPLIKAVQELSAQVEELKGDK